MIQKIFTSDVSFEAPSSPETFKAEWKPEINLELNSDSKKLKDDDYLVSLMITATAKNDTKIAFIAEVKQSGIFTVKGADKDQLGHILGAYCPETLFPYSREVIASLVSRGGFPPVLLAPLNFNAIYAQKQEQGQEKK